MKSRVIKFRAWNSRNKEMINPCFVEFYPDGSFNAGSKDMYPNTYPIDDNIQLMQFTGFVDSNGIDVYEGDILETEYGATGVVVWINNDLKFGFDCSGNMWSHPIHGMGGSKKIIGNVFENKQLIFPKTL